METLRDFWEESKISTEQFYSKVLDFILFLMEALAGWIIGPSLYFLSETLGIKKEISLRNLTLLPIIILPLIALLLGFLVYTILLNLFFFYYWAKNKDIFASHEN
jgi:hypothetical protein